MARAAWRHRASSHDGGGTDTDEDWEKAMAAATVCVWCKNAENV
jgi:hypothetical protein